LNNSKCNGWVNLAAVASGVYSTCREATLRVENGWQQRLTIGGHSALLISKQFNSDANAGAGRDPRCGTYRC
jgi:hypothetical protein